jgi:hypothetical protein
MFEKATYKCPGCGYAIGADLRDGSSFTCRTCGKRFSVTGEPDAGTVALFEDSAVVIPEPLYLPRGSIRALVAIMMALSCWVLILTRRDVPSYLFSLILTMVGYYFGFRMRVKEAESRIFDPAAEVRDPLMLPAGCIRGFLTMGFLVCGIALYGRGGLGAEKYLHFFVILAGLIVGHYFHKLFWRAPETAFYVGINHTKGLFVLAAAAWLAYLFLSGAYEETSPAMLMGLACAVSFYYGSRS